MLPNEVQMGSFWPFSHLTDEFTSRLVFRSPEEHEGHMD